jgi:hypothetical protein
MPDINAMTIEELRALIISLYATIEAMKKENETLKASLNKNSRNSSKPPSTDGFRKPIPNNREKTGNKPGGVDGHPGHRIEMPKDYQELITSGLATHEIVDHTGGCSEYVVKWEIDVKIVPVFIEHRFIKGEIPAEYNNEVTYGDEIKALTIDLAADGMMSVERLATFFSDITNGVVHPSKTALLGFEKEVANALDPELEVIVKDIINAPVLNVDESPMKSTETITITDNDDYTLKTSMGTTFNVNTRTYSTKESTIYTVNPHKDLAGVERDGILPNYHNILIHDHDIKYYNYADDHGECNVHPARELKELEDLGIESAGEIRAFLFEMNSYKNNDLEQGVCVCDPGKLKQFEDQFKALVKKGDLYCQTLPPDSYRYKRFNNLLVRFCANSDEHLLFMHDYSVDFSNNLAERDLRAEKTKQKVSGCFRSWQGIVQFMKFRSFISTLRKRRFNILDSLRSVCRGEIVLSSLAVTQE